MKMAAYMCGIVTLLCLATVNAGAGDTGMSISCPKMEGSVEFRVDVSGEDLMIEVTYPKSVASYLGGYVNGAKNYGAGFTVYLDTDMDENSGLEGDPKWDPGVKGSEFSIQASEITTSLDRDAEGNWINGQMLEIYIEKEGDYADLPEGVFPACEMKVDGELRKVDWVNPPDSKIVYVRVPLAVFGLQPDSTLRVSAVISLCNDDFPYPGIAVETLKPAP